MKIIFIVYILLLIVVGAWGDEDKLLGVCDVCQTRFYLVQGYALCQKCMNEYEEKGEIGLHPSRYCGVYCAHSWDKNGNEITFDGRKTECPLKNKPTKLKKDSL